MPKVGKIEYRLGGVFNQCIVNCNSNGVFSAKLPPVVAEALRVDVEIKEMTLCAIDVKFKDFIRRYETATTQEEVFIGIRYAANGAYNFKSNGNVLFPQNGCKYYLERRFNDVDAVGFEFNVIIRETIAGVPKEFIGKQGRDCGGTNNLYTQSPDKWFKQNNVSSNDKYTYIPYSIEAHDTLKNARETIRKMSEMLYLFITQDPAQIESQLINKILLS